jgi:hypothetical protein
LFRICHFVQPQIISEFKVKPFSKKRTFEKLLEESRLGSENDDLQSTMNSDRIHLNKTFNQSNILLNPNSLSQSFQSYVRAAEQKESSNYKSLTLQHWLFKPTTERYLVQDTILLLGGMPSESYRMKPDSERTDLSRFEITQALELKHITPKCLSSCLDGFLEIANMLQAIRESLNRLAEVDGGTVLQSTLTFGREYLVSFTEFLENLHLIFLSQSEQGK